MNTRRRASLATPVAVLMLVAGGAAPSWATFAETFKGGTSQMRTVLVQTGADGVPTLVRVSWVARCGHGAYRETTSFRPPFDEVDADHVRDAGTYHSHPGGGIIGVMAVKLSATHHLDPRLPDAESWTGTVSATVVVRKHARTIDRCHTTRAVGWTATLARG
jgi:hypothetical protein